MIPMLDGKLVVALGERDGVAGPAIAACAQAAGAEVAFSATECFV
jgi:glycine/sarcosine/betaine reductase complex component A